MKLQIISRLQQTKPQPLNPKKNSKREELIPSSSNILFENIENYISAHNAGSEEKHSLKIGNPNDFFKNFSALSSVQYSAVDFKQPNVKRKLESKLCLMTGEQKKEKENICKAFTFCQEIKNQEQEPKMQVAIQPQFNQQDYYYIHQKPKQKVRKFNSLITIRTEPSSQSDNRKPGFILKRNLSLMKKDSTNFVSDKENMNTANCEGLQRVESRQRLDKVDEQISQSKDRIARIRKELNEIYQSKKGNNTYRLKLY